MDYVEGENLKEIVGQKGALPVDQALTWIGQICDALIYMHSRQPPVIHRDIKPANIKITPQGNAVLVDFGIAKLYDPAAGTRTGRAPTRPAMLRQSSTSVRLTDVQSDIYSLGATTYTMLTGMEPPDTNAIFSPVCSLPRRPLVRSTHWCPPLPARRSKSPCSSSGQTALPAWQNSKRPCSAALTAKPPAARRSAQAPPPSPYAPAHRAGAAVQPPPPPTP